MYLGFQGLRALVQWLPCSVARGMGRGLGMVAYALLGSFRRLTTTQLQQALGQSLTSAQRRRIARGVFLNLGQNVIEWLQLPRLSSQDLQQLVVGEGVDHLRHALAQGNGVIIVSAHFGNWELMAPYVISLGLKVGVLARRLRYPEYESFLISMRGDKGVPTLARGSINDVATLLRANQIVGLMPDQDIDSLEGVFVNFFGRPAYTPVGPAALSLMTGAPILPAFIIRLPAPPPKVLVGGHRHGEGARFRMVFEPPVPRPDTRDRAKALTMLTQAWSDVVESYVRRYPDHWVWMHRRWKTQLNTADTRQQTADSVYDEQPHLIKRYGSHPILSVWLCAVCCVLCAGLLGCGQSTRSASTTARQEAAEQEMEGFRLTGYHVDGTKRWDLNGEGASLNGEIMTIQHPDGIGYDPELTYYLTASAAQVNQTNHHIRMEHAVTIHTSDGLWMSTPVLHWIPDEDRMATDQPVRIETDHMLVWGRGLEGWQRLKYAQLLEDVEMVLDSDAPAEGSPDGPSHATITCDGPLTFHYEDHIAVFEHNVFVNDPGGDLYSDTLIAYMDPKTHDMHYGEAIGHVRIVQDRQTAHSDRAFYEPSISKMTLVGRPSLLIYPDGEPQAPTPGPRAVLPGSGAGQAPPPKAVAEETPTKAPDTHQQVPLVGGQAPP